MEYDDLLIRVITTVSAGFHKINFTAHRPGAVGIIDRKHPNCRPELCSTSYKHLVMYTAKHLTQSL